MNGLEIEPAAALLTGPWAGYNVALASSNVPATRLFGGGARLGLEEPQPPPLPLDASGELTRDLRGDVRTGRCPPPLD